MKQSNDYYENLIREIHQKEFERIKKKVPSEYWWWYENKLNAFTRNDIEYFREGKLDPEQQVVEFRLVTSPNFYKGLKPQMFRKSLKLLLLCH